MVDHMGTEVHASPSTSSSAGYRVNEDLGCREFQDTVPFDDEMVLDSPLHENPFAKLREHTGLVDTEDCAEDGTLERIFGSDVEVVNDSEDDEGGTRRSTFADHSMSLAQTSATAVGILESDGSNDHDCNTGKKGSDCGAVICSDEDDPLRVIDDTYILRGSRLDFVDSQEPGESTQADALHFVDHFLMEEDLNVSQPVVPKNNMRMKSPPFSGAKGCQILAKRVKSQTPTMKTRIFDWTGNDPLGIRDPPITLTKTTCFKTREDHIADNDPGEKKWSIDLNEDVKDSTHPTPRSFKGISAENHRTEQTSGTSPENMFITQMDVQLQVSEPVEDLFDAGINTQIAAEAMGALLYAAPVFCNRENTCDSDPLSFHENHRKNAEGVAKKPNKENPSSNGYSGESLVSSSACNNNHLELAAGWATSKGVKRRAKAKKSSVKLTEKSITEKLYRATSSHAIKGSCKSSMNGSIPRESHRKNAEGVAKKPNKENPSSNGYSGESLVSSSACNNNHLELAAGWATSKGVKRRAKAKKSSVKLTEKSITEKLYRATSSHAIKGSCKSSVKLIEHSNEETENTGSKVSTVKYLLSLDEWKHPTGKRSRPMQRNHGSASKPCCVSSVTTVHTTVLASKSVKLDRIATSARELGVPSSDKRQTSCAPSAVVDNNVNVSKIASSRRTHGRGHKRPCVKNLPRSSSLLKELARLGASGKAAEVKWKDLRNRRNLGHVRVLFSQHLDDDTIKQQQKIMVRLGISLASTSSDATHFIADRFARTRNMLEAMTLGKPVVTHLWLESCGQARCLIDEKSYILRDDKKEKEIGFCMPTSLAHVRQSPLLEGVKVCITPNVKPDRDIITDLVKASHGQVVEISQTNDGELLDNNLLILSCEEDRGICFPFHNQGAAIYTPELVLNGIVIQKLEYTRHRLFHLC
ncbi:PREDICTED: uncharacterized protein LOC104801564 [Tarenaya hassleriana]|uniref:uncharacterized protein LOC104801564 n=1 Tax=Tarenaya hassleriana TaxID=28532 RepID=UPI00053C403C|nr:PREDICTED: uncharacterized protein LOC104801564 [Tarenaya hassleriana]